MTTIRPKKFYPLLILSLCSFILFTVTYCFEFSTGDGLRNALLVPWISLFDLFNHHGLNIIASSFAIVLIIFFLVYFIIWFKSTKSKSDRVFLSVFFVLLTITTVYALRSYDDYNIFTAYKGDTLGIVTIITALISIVMLSVANAYVTVRVPNEVEVSEIAEENFSPILTVATETVTQKVVNKNSSSVSKSKAIVLPNKNNKQIEKEPSFDEILYETLIKMKDEYDSKRSKAELLSQSIYYRNNNNQNVGGIRPIVVKLDGGKYEKVLYSTEELRRYV